MRAYVWESADSPRAQVREGETSDGREASVVWGCPGAAEAEGSGLAGLLEPGIRGRAMCVCKASGWRSCEDGGGRPGPEGRTAGGWTRPR